MADNTTLPGTGDVIAADEMDLGGPISLVSGLQININGVSSGTQPLFQGTAA